MAATSGLLKVIRLFCKRDLSKRPTILRRLLIEATPYMIRQHSDVSFDIRVMYYIIRLVS